ncbi:helix-turn-helix transcriptional regulator [Bacillus thuringiensis]|uniref:helix-turn-helix domain-containing protein n=1 Tax=Bacillus thuringiensis TaxID=1428 RepID=UPI00333B14CB
MSKVVRNHKPYFRFKAFLAENNIQQNEIANLLGKSVSAVNQNINGTGGNFSIPEIVIICKHYGISGDYYFFGFDVPIKELKVI